jgi:hypothetical protein
MNLLVHSEHLEEECLLVGLRLRETCGDMKIESQTSTATGIDRVATGKAFLTI